MTHSSFDERRKALENAFFHKRDEQLLQQFRDRMERLDRKAKLAEATGIHDESLVDRLIDLQIEPETLSALLLVPLIEVAWADGRVHAKQRQAVLTAAERAGLSPASDGHRLLERWLDEKPGPEMLQAWKDYVHFLAQRMEPAAAQTMRDDILDRAWFVAEAAGGIFGFHKVAREERAKLEELTALLEELAAAFA
jgi:hypothetical protein